MAGAVKERSTAPFDEVTLMPLGASGRVDGVPATLAVAAPYPRELWART